MGRYARKKGKASSCKGFGRRGGKTKTKSRDIDQIKKDMVNKQKFVEDLKANAKTDEDFVTTDSYCFPCARFFQDSDTLADHQTSKQHKRRVKKVNEWQDD